MKQEYITLQEEREISDAVQEMREELERKIFEAILYDIDIDNLIHF